MAEFQFSNDDIQRFSSLGLDVQGALDSGSTPEDISLAAKHIEYEEQAALAPVVAEQSRPVIPIPQQPLQEPAGDTDRLSLEGYGAEDSLSTIAAAANNTISAVFGFGIEKLGNAIGMPEVSALGTKIKEFANEGERISRENMSPQGQVPASRSYTRDAPENLFGVGLGDFNLGTVANTISSAIGSSVLPLAGGKGLSVLATKLGAGAKTAGAFGISTASGLTEGLATAQDVFNDVQNTPDDVIINSPLYAQFDKVISQQFPESQGSEKVAFVRRAIANQASFEAGFIAGPLIAATSLPIGGLLGQLGIGGKGGAEVFRKGFGSTLFKGAMFEGGQEFGQEASQQVIQNYGNFLAGKPVQPLAGSLEAGVQGLVGGSAIGSVAATAQNQSLPVDNVPVVDPLEEVIESVDSVDLDGSDPDVVGTEDLISSPTVNLDPDPKGDPPPPAPPAAGARTIVRDKDGFFIDGEGLSDAEVNELKADLKRIRVKNTAPDAAPLVNEFDNSKRDPKGDPPPPAAGSAEELSRELTDEEIDAIIDDESLDEHVSRKSDKADKIGLKGIRIDDPRLDGVFSRKSVEADELFLADAVQKNNKGNDSDEVAERPEAVLMLDKYKDGPSLTKSKDFTATQLRAKAKELGIKVKSNAPKHVVANKIIALGQEQAKTAPKVGLKKAQAEAKLETSKKASTVKGKAVTEEEVDASIRLNTPALDISIEKRQKLKTDIEALQAKLKKNGKLDNKDQTSLDVLLETRKVVEGNEFVGFADKKKYLRDQAKQKKRKISRLFASNFGIGELLADPATRQEAIEMLAAENLSNTLPKSTEITDDTKVTKLPAETSEGSIQVTKSEAVDKHDKKIRNLQKAIDNKTASMQRGLDTFGRKVDARTKLDPTNARFLTQTEASAMKQAEEEKSIATLKDFSKAQGDKIDKEVQSFRALAKKEGFDVDDVIPQIAEDADETDISFAREDRANIKRDLTNRVRGLEKDGQVIGPVGRKIASGETIDDGGDFDDLVADALSVTDQELSASELREINDLKNEADVEAERIENDPAILDAQARSNLRERADRPEVTSFPDGPRQSEQRRQLQRTFYRNGKIVKAPPLTLEGSIKPVTAQRVPVNTPRISPLSDKHKDAAGQRDNLGRTKTALKLTEIKSLTQERGLIGESSNIGSDANPTLGSISNESAGDVRLVMVSEGNSKFIEVVVDDGSFEGEFIGGVELLHDAVVDSYFLPDAKIKYKLGGEQIAEIIGNITGTALVSDMHKKMGADYLQINERVKRGLSAGQRVGYEKVESLNKTIKEFEAFQMDAEERAKNPTPTPEQAKKSSDKIKELKKDNGKAEPKITIDLGFSPDVTEENDSFVDEIKESQAMLDELAESEAFFAEHPELQDSPHISEEELASTAQYNFDGTSNAEAQGRTDETTDDDFEHCKVDF
jgi:hypothetical protein